MTLAYQVKDIAREIRWLGGDDNDPARVAIFNTLYDIGGKIAALQAENDVLRQRISEAYQKFGGGLHPYAAGAKDALNYVRDGKENESRRALDNQT